MNAAIRVSETEKRVADFLARTHQLFIGGKWVPGASGETLDVDNPSTGKPLARITAGSAVDIDRAVAAARQAFKSGPWQKMPASQRSLLLYRLADAIEANFETVVLIESLDMGLPVSAARHIDIPKAIEWLRYYAGWANKLSGETPLAASGVPGFSYTLREPIGVAGLIIPWNAVFLMAVNKIAPALAAGCTCVLKPAELAPMSALFLGDLIAQVGIPEGVVNIVTGLGPVAGQALVDHPDVNKISFTGSTRVGKSILHAAAGNLKRVTLELGGKSPIVVFADADIEKATRAISNELFFKTGQYCAAGTRLFAHAKVFDQLVSGISTRARELKIGPSFLADSEMGPVISQKQLDRVMSYIEAGRAQGASIVAGGNRLERDGYFVEATVLTNTRAGMSVRQDEIFGPVICVDRFESDHDLDQIAAQANDTVYGLAAKVWTRDLGTAHQMSRKLQAGTIIVNGGGGESPMPFGGVKMSGMGRENGIEGVLSYTELKTVAMGY
jgi:phenylacetaldehyde dehydrogenase